MLLLKKKSKMKKIKINKDFFFSNEDDLKFILGPCQIESKSHAFDICSEIDKLSKKLDFKYVYKSSFDKANRSSHRSKRGVGLKKRFRNTNDDKGKIWLSSYLRYT